MTPNTLAKASAKTVLLCWLLVGTATYYYRFTTRFWAAHGEAIEALWSRIP